MPCQRADRILTCLSPFLRGGCNRHGWINIFIQNEFGPSFSSKDVAALTAAFEAALSQLELVERNDLMTKTVAKTIIALAKQGGERDPKRLCGRTVTILGK
jgi:hypothetical protein